MKLFVLCLVILSMQSIESACAGSDLPTIYRIKNVVIPDSDKFIPFAMEIKAGDTVQWTNTDTDDHTIVSDDVFTSVNFRGINKIIHGTVNNGGHPGIFRKTFNHRGTFIYYCRFHSKLDKDKQPIAPGPEGGIQDEKGNYGTPMMGVITVMPRY